MKEENFERAKQLLKELEQLRHNLLCWNDATSFNSGDITLMCKERKSGSMYPSVPILFGLFGVMKKFCVDHYEAEIGRKLIELGSM
jgi:hypothetical protein